jgi:glutamyl-tRNA reductase
MNLLVVGCNHRTAPVEIREKLAFDSQGILRALDELSTRFGSEAVILSTCNRVELYLARADAPLPVNRESMADFLAEFHKLTGAELLPHLYAECDADAVRHLFHVVASLDSLIVGEGQIAGQVKRAYELAHEHGSVGPILHGLFQQAHLVAKRVRSETGISRGHASVSSAAVDYVRQVFDSFDDKTILVIGAGKMGEMTLRHLRELKPRHILVTNRSPEKAHAVAAGCGGESVPWQELESALLQADIALSTTGAPEPIMTYEHWEKISHRRTGGTLVILDIAVPRDFDSRIHDGDRTCLFNIDDLKRIRDRTLQDRLNHVAPAEKIIEEELQRFLKNQSRRRHGPVIASLTKDFEAKRQVIVEQLFARLNGKMSPDDKSYIEGAFRLLQNQFLHGPISALTEDSHEGGRHTLLDALRKLFRLHE